MNENYPSVDYMSEAHPLGGLGLRFQQVPVVTAQVLVRQVSGLQRGGHALPRAISGRAGRRERGADSERMKELSRQHELIQF
jgi:hypothetical protein